MKSQSPSSELQRLDRFGVIEISGGDAADFLQRQLTSDISEISSDRAQLSAYLNPKGRVIANFIIIMRNDAYHLVVAKELVQPLSNRLKLYVMRAKVEIKLRADLAFCGGQVISGAADSELPQLEFGTRSIQDATVVRLPGARVRYGMLADAPRSDDLSQSLGAVDSNAWQLQDIEAGIPWIAQQTSEHLLAQAINLDLINAVSWSKGCYPGQEIVARLHYRGGINRRLLAARSCVESRAAPGDEIACPDLPGRQTGTVVNASPDSNGSEVKLLVSVPLKFIDQKNFLLSGEHPVELQLERLPYRIPELETQAA